MNVHKEETILKEISKLKPSNKNKFYWWRRFETGEQPLSKRSYIPDKIEAGYYDFPISYFWQAQQALLELSKQHPGDIEIKTKIRSRYKRLMEDYYKDENIKLERIVEDFTNGYILKKEQVKEIMESFGYDIRDLYIHFEKNYKYPIAKSWKRTF
jgi:hypothetical protein